MTLTADPKCKQYEDAWIIFQYSLLYRTVFQAIDGMNKKKELTVNDMKRISNTDENPKRVHKKPTSFEEAVSLMINYRPKKNNKGRK